MAKKTNGKPARRGFACMSKAQRLSICCLGGKKTAKRYGKAHMARIGRRGRAKRTRMEKKRKVVEMALGQGNWMSKA